MRLKPKIRLLVCFTTLSKLEIVSCQRRKISIQSSDGSGSIPTSVELSNSRSIPLLGIGAGTIPHHKIPLIVSTSITDEYSSRLYDTSRSSSNEALVARALLRGMKQYYKLHGHSPEKVQVVHVVVKVWYTHLGYERTNLSVRESLNDLSPILTSAPEGWIVKVHALLQWARCNDEALNCEEEENKLDEHTKSVGASPLEAKEEAWKNSWRALEELHQAGILESIGISNFRYTDMMELLSISTVKPHFYQGNLATMLFDKDLMDLLKIHGIFFQAFNVMTAVLEQKDAAKKAFQALEKIAKTYVTEDDEFLSVPGLLLSWLMQRRVGAIVATSDQEHLGEITLGTIQKFPTFISKHDLDIEIAVGAILKQVDITDYQFPTSDSDKGVVTTFFNSFTKPLKIFLLTETGHQVPVSTYIESGKNNRIIANPGDIFIIYDAYGTAVKKYRVLAEHGGEESFSIEEE